MSSGAASDAAQAVAIVGMACRFPKAPDLEAFWESLRDGVEGIAPVRDDELLAAGVDAATVAAPDYVKAASYVEGIELFDAPFFGINPREAEILDPQQRLLLECAWEAFEHAGYDPQNFAGRIGVYAAGRISDYFLYHLSSNPELLATVGPLQTLFANDKDYLATVLSYRLDLRGPSVTVQTACSSALVCVHLACESLLNGECDMALAGAVSLRLPQKAGYMFQEGGILSRDGHCRSFDAAASGTVFGNGLGAVVLKRLDRALADGDTVHAVVLGSAVNNDGGRKLGFAAPSEDGQAAVIAEAQEVAAVDPETIGYVEAHGSATPLGDPIELGALARAFAARGAAAGSCAVGSVKSNLGHLEAAAGMAGLLKTVLMLRHRALVPSLHFSRLNPEIALDRGPFRIATAFAPWPADGAPRRAGVNSFGLGGTNAHVVLEEAPEPPPATAARALSLLVLSARTPAALRAAGERLRHHLERHPDLALADAAYTAQVGRRAFAHRQVVVAGSAQEAAARLASGDPAYVFTGRKEARDRQVAFLFPGLGEHYPGMAEELYRGEEVFRRHFDHCAELLRPWTGGDLRDLLYGRAGREAASSASSTSVARGPNLRRLLRREAAEEDPAWAELQRTQVAQPAVFAVEWALAQQWISWGVRPQALIGYSLGEYVAACLAGVMPLADAAGLVGLRACLIEQLPAGAMTAVPLPEETVRPLLGPGLAIAAGNGGSDCVVAGEPAAVEEFERRLAGLELPSLRLPTRHAFHSPMLAGAAAELTAAAARIELAAPAIPYVSNLTGRWIRDEEARDPGYWARHMCETVRFAEGLDLLLAEADRVLLEVGPGQGLATLARRAQRRTDRHLVLASLRHRDDGQDGLAVTLSALGRLWVAGLPVDWEALHRGERRRRVPLPSYPFERRKYWVERRTAAGRDGAPAGSRRRPAAAGEAHALFWRQALPPAGPLAAPPGEGPWLLLGEGQGLQAALATRLRVAGRRVATAAAGPGFARLGPGRYQVDPLRREDYAALLAELAAEGAAPAVVVHLLALDAAAAVNGGGGLAPGLHSLVRLAQGVGLWNPDHPLRLAVVAGGMVEVTGRDRPRPHQAMLLAACRVIPQEYARIRCRAVDVDPPGPDDEGSVERLAGRLAAELAGDAAEPLTAWRGGRRWLPAFAPIALPAPAPALPGGAVLITGGLGGLGLTLAASLAELPGARLALLGRTPLPERGAWESRRDRPDGGAVGERIAKVASLEARGAEVLTVCADVADEAQMSAALAAVRRRFGRIGGVIHAAGVAGGGLIQLQTPEKIAAVLAPKVEGALVLDRLLEEDAPELFVVFSSTLATLGGIGQLAYAAANCFLESFALERSSRAPGTTLAIAWDRWLDVGMAASGQALPAEPGEEPPAGLLASQGVDAFWRVLAAAVPQVVVTRQDFQAAVEQARSPLDPAALEDRLAELAPALGGHPRPELQTPYVTPDGERERRLARIWEELLGLERVGAHDNFFELGGDSLRGIQAAAKARRLGLGLTTQLLFQHPTIAELAARLGEGAAPPAPERVETPVGAAAQGDAAEAAARPLTPADFPQAGLSQGELDALLTAFGDSEE
jgi:acyl transferase domain-containing protein/aryl carrier-like protein